MTQTRWRPTMILALWALGFALVLVPVAILDVQQESTDSPALAELRAPENDDDPAPGEGATSFEAGEDENVSGLGLMVGAYMALWVLLIGYFFSLFGRHKKIGNDLTALKKRVDAIDDQLEDGA